MLDRVLRDQKPDGSWLLNLPSRDRHATFDAVFTLRQLGERAATDCRAAIERAARLGADAAATPTAASATSPAARPTPTRSTSRSARW